MLEKKYILQDRTIAILAADGFDEAQLFSPKKALEEAGAKVIIVSLKDGVIKGKKDDHWGKSIKVEKTVNNSSSREFDALLIPGGEENPEALRIDKNAIEFVKSFINEGKSVASICHGTQVLLETGLTKGKFLSACEDFKKKFLHSGAKWKNDDIVAHKGIITCSSQNENPKFNKLMIEGFSISPRSKKTLIQ